MKELLKNIDWNARLDQKKLFLAGLVVVIIVYMDLSLLLGRQFSEMSGVCARINKLSADLERKSAELAAAGSDGGAVVSYSGQDNQAQCKAVLPAIEDLPLILRDISRIALQNRVKIMQILPQGECPAKELPPEAAGLKALIVNLDLSGRYFDTADFISAIENGMAFAQVQSMRVRRDKNDYTKQDINVILRIYVKKGD